MTNSTNSNKTCPFVLEGLYLCRVRLGSAGTKANVPVGALCFGCHCCYYGNLCAWFIFSFRIEFVERVLREDAALTKEVAKNFRTKASSAFVGEHYLSDPTFVFSDWFVLRYRQHENLGIQQLITL